MDKHNHGEALAKRETITEMVSQYHAGIADLRAGWGQIEDGIARLERAFGDGKTSTFCLRERGGRTVQLDLDAVEGEVRRDVWRALVDRLNVRSMMSSRRADELARQLDREAVPEVTVENVETFVRGYMTALPEMLREAVDDVFGWLRPRAGTRGAEYKSNGQFEIGPKVVLTHAGELTYRGTGLWIGRYTRAKLLSLESVFRSLDGRGQIVERGVSAIEEGLRDSLVVETPYFRGRAFKNGNLHLEFRRLDLLKRFNALAGGKTLRDKAAE